MKNRTTKKKMNKFPATKSIELKNSLQYVKLKWSVTKSFRRFIYYI